MLAYLPHHRLHAIQRAQQLHALFRQVNQAFGRARPHLHDSEQRVGR
jgi:hypothetical protein